MVEHVTNKPEIEGLFPSVVTKDTKMVFFPKFTQRPPPLLQKFKIE